MTGAILGKSPEFFFCFFVFWFCLVFSMFLFGTFSLPMVIIEVQPKTSNYLTPTYLIPEKVMLFVVHSEEHFYCKYQ